VGFWRGLGLVVLGVLDLIGLPYVIEGIVGRRAFGKELKGFERWERLGTGLVFLGAALLTAKGLLRGKPKPEAGVKEPPVEAKPDPKAEYEKINPAEAPTGYTFKDVIKTEMGEKSIVTDVTAPDGSSGWIERAVDELTGKVILKNAFLDEIPKPYRVVEVGGKKIPLVDYMTLRQFRLLGVGYAGFPKVKLSTIQNVRTVAHIEAAVRGGGSANEAAMTSHSVTYARRSIETSGKRVVKAEVQGGSKSKFDEMLEWYETNKNPGGPRDPERVEANDAVLKDHGLTRDDVVWWNYDINLTVEAIDAPTPAPAGGVSVPAPAAPPVSVP
jgi:hypothetical protein